MQCIYVTLLAREALLSPSACVNTALSPITVFWQVDSNRYQTFSEMLLLSIWVETIQTIDQF